MLISEDYRALNTTMHVDKPLYGTSGHKWAKPIEGLISHVDAHSVLDYGCGKQTLRDALPHRDITGYDPALEGLDDDPIAHDLVVCSDVLEHVEPDCIDAVLDHLRRLSIKAVFLLVATIPARKHLPDGRNAHILQRPPEWWMPKIMSRWNLQTYRAVRIVEDSQKKAAEFFVTAMAK